MFSAHTTPKKAGRSLHGFLQTLTRDPRHHHKHPLSEAQVVFEALAGTLAVLAPWQHQAVGAEASATSGPTSRVHSNRSMIVVVYERGWQEQGLDATKRQSLSKDRARCWLLDRCRVRGLGVIRIQWDSKEGEAVGRTAERDR